jgi:uncharacterized protein YyaL (SSP411 family)
MNVFLTPDLKPFFGGTYFPPDDKYGHIGLRKLLPRVAEVWSKQHEDILRSADGITENSTVWLQVPTIASISCPTPPKAIRVLVASR